MNAARSELAPVQICEATSTSNHQIKITDLLGVAHNDSCLRQTDSRSGKLEPLKSARCFFSSLG